MMRPLNQALAQAAARRRQAEPGPDRSPTAPIIEAINAASAAILEGHYSIALAHLRTALLEATRAKFHAQKG